MFHVRHPNVFARDRRKLLVIKGGKGSRLFKKAHLIGEKRRLKSGSLWQLITPQMAKIFGNFRGVGSLQRSTPRWVEARFIAKAKMFIESCR